MAKKNIKTNKSVKENEANVILDFTQVYQDNKKEIDYTIHNCKEQMANAAEKGRKVSIFARVLNRFKTWCKK